jgi:very-short-patch-repair endonuclease
VRRRGSGFGGCTTKPPAIPTKRRTPLAPLAGRQHGCVSTAQLTRLGYNSAAIAEQVAAGRLHRKYRGVYAVGHPNLSRHGEWMAAVLAAGPGAALSHIAAASLHGIWTLQPKRIDVLTPRLRRPQRGFTAHSCRHLDPRDVTIWRGIPVTTVARTLVDLTDLLDWARLANVIHEAAYRDLFDPAATRAAMARATGRRRLPVLERALEAHASGSAGTRSRAEERFLAAVEAAGLPDARVNTPAPVPAWPGTAGIEVDFLWPELGLCVEVDGPGHARPRTRREDEMRDRLLTAAGFEVVRVSDRALPPPSEPPPYEAEAL